MTAWKAAHTAPEEISREKPVLVLVSFSKPPSAPPNWNLVAAYRTKHDQWKAYETGVGLDPVYWTEIPMPFPTSPP